MVPWESVVRAEVSQSVSYRLGEERKEKAEEGKGNYGLGNGGECDSETEVK